MMRKLLLSLFLLIAFNLVLTAQSGEHIVFTAYQNFISRLYVLDYEGTVITYHEYTNYRLQDMTVIDNEVYVTDAFIPCVYRVDIYTGELELVLHDLWLFYFYGVAWDGTYFYVAEWDLNRYDINGVKDGTADFDEDVMGATFADGYYWMLNNENEIKCWDFAEWPQLFELPDNQFSPPTPECRGLWYDGEYLWTAESIESNLGKIYRFDFEGQVVEEWTAPAFQGWGACKVEAPPVGLTENPEAPRHFKIFPNPANEQVELELTTQRPGKAIVGVYDLSGVCLQQSEISFNHAGKHKRTLPVSQTIPPGSYLIRVKINGNVYSEKLMIGR